MCCGVRWTLCVASWTARLLRPRRHDARGLRSTKFSTLQSRKVTSLRILSTGSGGRLRRSTKRWTRLPFPTRLRLSDCSRRLASSAGAVLTLRRSSAACTTRPCGRRRSSTSGSNSAICPRPGGGCSTCRAESSPQERNGRMTVQCTRCTRSSAVRLPRPGQCPSRRSSYASSVHTSNGSAWRRTADCSGTRPATTWMLRPMAQRGRGRGSTS